MEIITENTLIRDKFIDIPEQMTDGQIAEASAMVSKIFVGKKFSEIVKLGSVIAEEFESYREIFESVMNAIEDYVEERKPDVFLEGEDKILNHPEYNDSEKVKNFLFKILYIR